MLVNAQRPKTIQTKVEKQVKRMIFGNRQLCLICKFKPIIGNKFLRTQEIGKTYIHAPNCSQIGRF